MADPVTMAVVMMGTKLVLLFLLMPRLQAQKQARQRQNKMQRYPAGMQG